MVWVKVDDDFPQHPKARKAGAVGMALWLAGLCYSSHYLTDGLVPVEVLAGLLPLEKKELTKTIDVLVFAGLWSMAEGGYQIHDYLDYQPARSQILAERQVAKDRMQAHRSGNVRANKTRSSGDVREMFKDPTPTPVPTPSPKEQNPPVVPPLPERDTAPAKRRAERIPQDWQPSATLTVWATTNHPSIDVRLETERFTNHAVANGRTLLDWDAGWRNWVLKAEEIHSQHPNGNGNGSVPTNRENLLAAMREDGVIP